MPVMAVMRMGLGGRVMVMLSVMIFHLNLR